MKWRMKILAFETTDGVRAVYLYNADHEIISTYRWAVTPKHNYPTDLYSDPRYNGDTIRETTALPTGSMSQYLGMDRMSLMLIKIHNLQSVARQYDYDMSLYSFSVKEDLLALSGREALADNICRAVETLDIQAVEDAVTAAVEHLLPGQQELPADTTRQIVRQAAAYIDENYFEDLNLSVLAEKFNVESSYFNRVFKKNTGMSPREYRNSLSIQEV